MLQDLLAGPPCGEQTVPDALLGCWRRNWIRFGDDGAEDTSVTVVWLQTASGMGDVRIDPTQQPHESDSSCGITVVDETTKPYMTADWLDGTTGFTQQPTSNFPEKGWLDWRRPTLLYELAPSGAYVEEWERLDDSTDLLAHLVAHDAATTTNLYIAGRHLFLAQRRGAGGTVDEYSYGRVGDPNDNGDDRYNNPATIELSTIAEHTGLPMNLAYDWSVVSLRH